jgi:myo-inositol 2-dehydrogenase/D-chiro-inositol 1-dehydrogenase/scyllo-inositol 2-dehydrogenase (NAD+)
MQKKDGIGLCLIGCGRAGMIHARNFANRVPGARMAAVADIAIEAARAAARELDIDAFSLDYRDFLRSSEVDAVIVVSPTDLHCGIVKECAAHGKHVFCEKPMAMNGAECREMIDACDAAGVKLQIGFMRRFDRSFARAKELLDAGAIGDLVLIKSHTRGPSKPRPWMYDLKKSNGILAEVNSHDIDAVRWYSNSDFSSLYAVGGNYRNPEVREEYPDYYDNVVVTGSLKSGAQFVIDGAAYVQYGYDSHVELVGTKGVLHVGGSKPDSIEFTVSGEGTRTNFVNSWTTLFEDAYLNEDIAFVKAITENLEPMVTGLDGLMAVAAVEAGNESIRESRIVSL